MGRVAKAAGQAAVESGAGAQDLEATDRELDLGIGAQHFGIGKLDAGCSGRRGNGRWLAHSCAARRRWRRKCRQHRLGTHKGGVAALDLRQQAALYGIDLVTQDDFLRLALSSRCQHRAIEQRALQDDADIPVGHAGHPA